MSKSFFARARGAVLHAAADALPPSIVLRHGDPASGKVALTFDDGPDDLTREYLDLLDRLRVRASFFLVGAWAKKRPDEVLEILRRGHDVAGHGFTHARFPDLSGRELANELDAMLDSLPLGGPGRKLVRPPQGATSVASLARSARHGFRTVLWTIDSDDCRTKEPRDIVTASLRANGGDIVLLHEGQRWTLEALPEIVAGLRAKGLTLTRVSEMM